MERPRPSRIIAVLVLVLVALEVGLNVLRAPSACIRIGNEGTVPILDVVAECGEARATVARIAPGEAANLYISGRRKAPATIRFHQRGNALSAYEVPEFDPGLMERDRSRLVLNIRNGEIERYQEEAEASVSSTLVSNALDWLRRSLTPL